MSIASKLAKPLAAVVIGSAAYGFAPAPQPAPERIVIASTGGSFLGIGVSEITSERAKALSLSEERGVEVTRVEEDTPASRAGLKTGDVILEYNSQRVEGTEQLVRLVRETPADRDVRISISRGGSLQTVIAKVGSRRRETGRALSLRGLEPQVIELPEIRMPDIPKAFMSWRSAALGIEGESIDSQLAQYFGVKEGVLVRSVLKDSAAEKAGIKAGDVITKVDGTPVLTSREISSAIRNSAAKKSISITLTRERREMTIPVTLDQERQNGALNPARPRATTVGVSLP